jgi:cellulose synthase operon protein YhjQ
MDSRSRDRGEEETAAGTPEDVAILYSWANLHGAKYRDFSASRREYRAQIRHRAAETLRERELKAQADAEAAAHAAERAAQIAEAAAYSQNTSESQSLRTQSLRNAEAAARRAAAERVEAARRAEAAAMAEAAARREEREIAEAHASAQRQASIYAESEIRRRQLAGPQPRGPVPGEMTDPYLSSGSSSASRQAYQTGRFRAVDPVTADEPRRRPQGYHPDEASGVWQRSSSGSSGSTRLLIPDGRITSDDIRAEELRTAEAVLYTPLPPPLAPPYVARPVEPPNFDPGGVSDPQSGLAVEELQQQQARAHIPNDPPPPGRGTDPSGPAWLYAPKSTTPVPRPRAPQPPAPPVGGDTLQDSRERVAARWFALKGVFEHPGPELPALQPIRKNDSSTPILAVFSLSGGVGKTSLVATLGRALSSRGEKVMLTDTTSHGLLPFYFGARELRPGVVRTFSPPAGSTDAPIYLVSYDVDQKSGDSAAQEELAGQILGNSRGNHRVVLDLSSGSSWLIRRLANLHPTVLVPMAPDMNSVISLQAVERFFQGITDSEGHALQPFYVLNQFDATLPLHLDVREVFRRQLGERLLPFVIRRSPAVSEALAEGMTVVDYAPEAPVSHDYLEVASWLRSVSAPATAGFRNVRWSER